MDNKQLAHDIAAALVPKYMDEVEINIYRYDKDGVASINAESICSAYKEIYDSILAELSK